MKLPALFTAFITTVCATGILAAQVPPLINYQGRVAVNGTNFNGTGQFRFALVNADGTDTLWSNDGTSVDGSQPTEAVPLNVAHGLYSVLLGDSSLQHMTALPVSVFANPDIRLRVWFDDGTTGPQLLTPDQRLTPVAYFADGSIQTPALAPNAVTSANIAPGAVNGSHVAAGALSFNNLNVPAPPGPGQVLGYDGGGLVWTTPSGSAGNSFWNPNGPSVIYYNAGRVGLGTSGPAHRLTISDGPGWTSNFWKGAIELDNGSAIGWTNGAGPHFGLGHSNGSFLIFRTNSLPGTTGNAANYDFAIAQDGKVGIGTADPASKLDVRTDPIRYGFTHTAGSISLGSFIGTTAGWFGTSTEHPLYLFTNDDLPSFAIDTVGRVGIGTTSPVATLTVAGAGAYNSPSAAAIMLHNTAAGKRWEWHALDTGALQLADYNAAATRLVVDGAGNVGIGVVNPQSKLEVNGTLTTKVLTITGGADIAEPFPMKEEAIRKGSVVVIDSEHPGRLKRSTQAYDRRVAGIISGANGVNPGIALHQEGVMEGDHNVALSGRVYVEADASTGPIEPGDLLTTSELPGHAMKVTDHTRAQGAVIGKAMSALSEGTGLVLVLVTLQ